MCAVGLAGRTTGKTRTGESSMVVHVEQPAAMEAASMRNACSCVSTSLDVGGPNVSTARSLGVKRDRAARSAGPVRRPTEGSLARAPASVIVPDRANAVPFQW